MLRPGERSSEQLRKEISDTDLVIGVLSPDTTDSTYVLRALGATCERDAARFPVIIRAATFAEVSYAP